MGCRIYFFALSKKAGNMGKEPKEEMLFQTKEEYLKFADVIKDKPKSYYAFEILYWCDIRVGELLALTMNDFDLEKKFLSINKSYHRLEDKRYEAKWKQMALIINICPFMTTKSGNGIKEVTAFKK